MQVTKDTSCGSGRDSQIHSLIKNKRSYWHLGIFNGEDECCQKYWYSKYLGYTAGILGVCDARDEPTVGDHLQYEPSPVPSVGSPYNWILTRRIILWISTSLLCGTAWEHFNASVLSDSCWTLHRAKTEGCPRKPVFWTTRMLVVSDCERMSLTPVSYW